MMLSKLLRSEWSKIKGKGLWLLAFLGPMGVIGLTMVNYGLRRDFLLTMSEDDWGYYVESLGMFTTMALTLGIAILTSMLASIEGQTNAWKLWLALPVKRSTVYLSKYILVSCLLLISCIILASGTVLYGITLDLGDQIPWRKIIEYSFFPWLFAQGSILLHLWCALVSQNQAFTISLGVVGVIVTLFEPIVPNWVIWKWPSFVQYNEASWLNLAICLSVAFVIGAMGMLHFVRKDVN